MENGQMFQYSELSEQNHWASSNDASLTKSLKLNEGDEVAHSNGNGDPEGAAMIESLQISRIKKSNGVNSETEEVNLTPSPVPTLKLHDSEAQSDEEKGSNEKGSEDEEKESEDEEKTKSDKGSDEEKSEKGSDEEKSEKGSDDESASADSGKEGSAFSNESGLSNYECGESSGSESEEKADSDSDFNETGKSDSNYSSDEINFKKKKDRKKDRYWEGKEEIYGVRRSHRENTKKKSYRTLDDSASDNSNDDSAAFFKSGGSKKKRGYRNLSESDGSKSNSDYSPSEEAWGGAKKKKFKRVKKPPPEFAEREVRTRKKKINYKVPEEADPLGSGTDEEDKIYIEVDENAEPEEPSEKIEKVLTHRTGPAWEIGEPTAQSAGGLGLKCLETKCGPDDKKVVAYFIKWSRFSHIHNTWETEQSLEEKKCKGMMIFHNYFKKAREVANWKRSMTPEDREYYDVQDEMQHNLMSQWTTVNRIIHHATTKDEEGNTLTDYLVKWHGLPYSESTWEKDDYFKQHHADKIEAYEKMKNSDTKPTKNIAKIMSHRPKFKKLLVQPDWIPEGLELRDYQVDGLNWLAHSWIKGNSAILADEMGLGKTIQTVCFLNFLFHNANLYGPFLLVVPLSTMRAWEREFKKWAPNMNTIIYIGDQASRSVIQDHEWKMPNGAIKFNAVVTSYEIILKDEEFFGGFPWAVLAVDEAHRLKNDQSALYKVLIDLKTYHRLLITGTPLQNSLKELWALLHFICPDQYPSFEDFEAIHGNMQTMNSEALGRIHTELEPYLFRRVKKDVEKSLPGKTEQILRVDMTARQKQYYKWILTKNFKALNRENKGSQGNFMNILMELKKCCNHCELTIPLDAGTQVVPDLRLPDLVKGSGKLWLLDKLLERCKQNGNRVLIFSQMVRLLDLISEYLELKKYKHQRLDGGIKGEVRAQALDHFNADGSSDFCFLLSTRAGGLGINLATADTVVIFDSDWNPQNDLQAMARAHRIGQKKKVSIYRLITKNSVEEDIIERAKKKMILDHLVIQRMDTTGRTVLQKNAPNKNIPFNKDELTAILKFGAVDLFKDDNEGDTHLEHLNIDTVLKEAETREQEEEETGVGHDLLSQFKVANFTIEEEAGPGWNSIIPADQLDAMDAETEQPLYIAPRRKQKVNYTGTLNRTANSDQSEDGEHGSGRSKRRKLSAPKHKKKKSRSRGDEDDYDEASMFTDAEIRKFMKSFRKFGPPLERLKDIGKDACLSASLPELESLVECIHRKCDEAEGYAMNNDGSSNNKKGLTILIGRCSFPLSQIKARENLLNNLSVLPREAPARYKWRLDKKTKPTGWDIDWTEDDDSLLLIGVYNYGLGSWEQILKDSKIGLGEKVSLEGDLKPKAEHLQTRAEYLLRNLAKLVTKSPEKAKKAEHPKKKSSRSRKKKVTEEEMLEELSPDEEEVEEEEPASPVEKKKTKKSKKTKKEKDKKGAEGGPTEWSDATFKKCKEMMRPVRKTLRMLENPNSELSKKEQLRQTKSYLLTIGDQIEKAGVDKSDAWKQEWTQSLWVFVSQFTPIDAKKLQMLYTKALAQQAPEGDEPKAAKKRKR